MRDRRLERLSARRVVGVTSERDDLVELSRYAWQRLRDRMAGLTDDEYFWEPVAGCLSVRVTADGTYRADPAEPAGFTTLAWRLSHIVDFLSEDRNGPWLGRPALPLNRSGAPGSADEALAALEAAYGTWRTVLEGTESLAEPIGALAGPYGTATRRAFALHVLDELIHHGAEAALLRDLYRAKGDG
ncbi:DinB family protein [Kibdelosporangium lantanae]